MSKPPASLIRTLLISAVLLGCGGFFAYSLSSRLGPGQSPQTSQIPEASAIEGGSLEGQAAPGFEVSDIKGKPVSLAQHRGKIVFLNFWATWCEPCKTEMPSMERLYQKLKGRPFEILAVSLDANPAKDIPAFLSKTKLQLSFPLLAEGKAGLSKELYRTTGVPESFIIGADGKVIKHVIGAYEWDSPEILEYFDGLLKDVAASAPQTPKG